ncbi:HORMA domain-containing protein 1-like isoform X3 [Malaclemys terrapin pileata]|uniref:HORMA domain-containing protein 1-like isoform X3 n=1 Tax=Malaclemys terrapin pileata TaxID=2991368 RepID=UPI0023A84A61|nr:HORMA domain-containing protein 1-like isoform X3 [Malaclemys terrapin pileata]
MATIQKFRTARKQDTCGWATLFPREIKTHQQSLVMVKRIMAVAVSGITYLRGIFPEDAYSTHYLEDLCVKVLREDSIYPRVSKIVKWMKGCFEALEKKYLQMMILGRQDTLVEYINTDYEPPGSEEEFVDKYHKVKDEATKKRKISKKNK